MIIQLPEDVENSILAKVETGIFPSLDAVMTEAARLLLDRLEQGEPRTDTPPVPPWKKLLEFMESVPDEVFERIPVDSSAQLDHYLYGTRKYS